MNISYLDQKIRSLCYSLTNDESTFTAEEIVDIRSHIADLRAAPNLADAPMEYSLMEDKKRLKIELGRALTNNRIRFRALNLR